MTTNFKARTFRLNKSSQYADKVWLNSLGTIATSSTAGETVSVKVAYLDDDDNAVPAVFGSMSWRTATEEVPAYCKINLFDGTDMVTAMYMEPSLVTFNGDCNVTGRVYAAQLEGTLNTSEQPQVTSLGTLSGLTVDGPLYVPSLPTSSGTVFLTWDPSTGEVSYSESSAIQAYEQTGELPNVTITDSLYLPNVPTFRTPYLLHLEPMLGGVFTAEAPYAVTTTEDGVIDSVAFTSTVIADNVKSTGTVQVGSDNDVWRLRPDTTSGSLAVEKLEQGVWVAKSMIGTV
jgi:hypothetical protein